MPLAPTLAQYRLRFVQALSRPGATVTAVCQEFGLSRPTFYKWRWRLQEEGLLGLHDHSRAPHHSPQALPKRWRHELVTLRQQNPHWGAKKLRHLLQRQHPRAKGIPALRTLERWLHQAQLTVPPTPAARPGPRLARPRLTAAQAPNEVWTIDFKGWFRLGDGRRCDPLTVRDLASRFVLAIVPVPATSDLHVRAAMRPLFRRWGLPRIIRIDNGPPFGNLEGPLNLTSLSVWWWRLGIQLEFTRPGKPQDNGAHEQMHRILKAETLSPPALHLRAQQRRFCAWQKSYNEIRPHEALGGRCPAEGYHHSPRPYLPLSPLIYPEAWLTRRVLSQGTIKWMGRTRHVGRAFAGQTIGLQPLDAQRSAVHLGPLCLGTLHLQDAGGLRASTSLKRRRRPATSPPPRKPSRGGQG